MSDQNEGSAPPADEELREEVRSEVRAAGVEAVKQGGSTLVLTGVLSVLGGIFCIMAPNFMGWMGTMLFGFLMMLFGGLQIFSGIDMEKKTKGRGWTIFGGVLAIIVGLFFVIRPFDGMAVLTWMIAIFLLIEGGFRIAAAFELKPEEGWGWVLLSGLAAILLGIMIIAKWPYSSLWFLGTVIGIHFLMSGVARIVLGMAARKVAKQAGEGG